MENFTPVPTDPLAILHAAWLTILNEMQVDQPPQPVIVWTGTKTEAVEFIYELTHVGVFNNGKASTAQVTKWFEYTFHIDLGNVSKIFQDIRNRKKETAAFAHKLEKALLRYIDELDQEDSEKNQLQKRA